MHIPSVRGLKHFVGKNAVDFQVLPDGVHFDNSGLLARSATDDAKPSEFYPQELLAMMLDEIKVNACTRLGASDVNAVITVPSFFGLSERQAFLEAAKLAGLTVLQLLNASTAAAIAYSAEPHVDGQRHIAVLDIGGSDLDACIASVDSGKVCVVASTGVEHLGGDRLTKLLVDFVVRDIQSRHGKDLSTKPRALRRIEKECEKTKKLLSSAQRARIQLDVDEETEYVKEVRRDFFEGLCAEVVPQMMITFATMLKTSGLEPSAIDEVVLVGGSSRVPLIREAISRLLGNTPVNTSLNVDEAVVTGAAHLAASFGDSPSSTSSNIVVKDLLTQSLRIDLGCGDPCLIPVATRLPHRIAIPVSEVNDTADVQVYEASEGVGNRLLDNYRVTDVGSTSASESFELIADVNESGVLGMTLVRKRKQREPTDPPSAAFPTTGGDLFVKLANGRYHGVNQSIPVEKLPVCPDLRKPFAPIYEKRGGWTRAYLTWIGCLYVSVRVEQIPTTLVYISATPLDQAVRVSAHCAPKQPTLVREPDGRSLTTEQFHVVEQRLHAYRSAQDQRSAAADARNELHEKCLAFERFFVSKCHVNLKASEVNQIEELRRKVERVLRADASDAYKKGTVEKHAKYIKRLAQWTKRVNELEAAQEAAKARQLFNQLDAAIEVLEDANQVSSPLPNPRCVDVRPAQNAMPLEDLQAVVEASANLGEHTNYGIPVDPDMWR